MATMPEKEEAQPTRVTRAVKAVTAPATRLPLLLALAAACVALAPTPLDAAGAALVVLVAAERR